MNQCLEPSASSVNALVFSGGEIWNENDRDAQENLRSVAQSVSGTSSRSDEEQNVSAYVRAFEDMVCTVIKEETHLLSDEEFGLLTVFAHLSCMFIRSLVRQIPLIRKDNARFLMVKLLLRKQDTWHRLDTLNYESELGSTSAIVSAIEELCKVVRGTSDVIKKEEPVDPEIIKPAMDESVPNLQQRQEKPASADAGFLEPLCKDRPFILARNEGEMDLKSLLECLRLDELKAVAKQLKVKTNQKKDELIRDLLGTSSSQSTLTGFARRGITPPKDHGCHQTGLLFSRFGSQRDRLKEIALRSIVKCVRVDEEFFGVIHRVNLVYFRITQYTPGILVAALLTRFGKRAYPGYDYERTKNVWPTRQALLDYEEVLLLEGQVDALLAGNVPPLAGRAVGSKTPVSRFLPTPFTPGNRKREEGDVADEDTISDRPDSIRVRGARMVKDIFESVYPRWKDLLKTEDEEDKRPAGLQRFHHGHVLTRIVCKGSAALGTLREYERELEVLEALLAQTRWRRGQRGRWHERRTLILSTHLPREEETLKRALNGVIDALVDPDTHIVFRSKLQRRLTKLENKLKIPNEDRHTYDGVLVDADEIVFEATRIRHRAANLKLDRTGRCINAFTPEQGGQDIKHYYSPVVTPVKPESNLSVTPARTKASSDIPKGKSLWLGRNDEELTVESLALQRYEDQGFKGLHCETRVIAMLFGLLFWDIIFKSIPGAFETPYQTAPLDIAEDSFYHARKDLMEERLAAIEAGKGVDLVQAADTKNRVSQTWGVGIQWDLFSSEDLVDIVTCIGGKALSVICRVLCEDYTLGTSGGPDLFLWNAEKGTCKFVEVKGPGDSLQENQRVWIDILLKAPVAVEICRVVETGNETDKKPNARTPKSTRRRLKKTHEKGDGVLDDLAEPDALPMFDDQRATPPVATGAHPPLGHVDPRISTCSAIVNTPFADEGTSSPLKRKAREDMSPTPSKRPRSI